MTITKPKALVILSGGQDSTTCLLWAKARYDELHAITFDYGQKHSAEIAAARNVAEIVGVASHTIMDVRGLLLGRSPLVNPDTPLETYADHDSMAKTIGNRIELTFVPLRNLLFLVLAANKALSLDCFTLVTGICAEDNANYPDCTATFVDHAELAMREALGMRRPDYQGDELVLETPLLHLKKSQTVALAMQFLGWMDALAASHTCYAGLVPPCGKCHACILRAKGFADAGIVDPLVQA